MGMLAAIGLAPALKPEPTEDPGITFQDYSPGTPDAVDVVVDEVIPHPPMIGGGPVMGYRTQLTFQLNGRWLPGGNVLEVDGPEGLVPMRGMGSGIDFTVAGGTSDVSMLEAMVSGEKIPFRLTFGHMPNEYWEFHGYVTNWAPTFAEPVEQTVTLSIDIAGDPAPQFCLGEEA